MSEVKQVIKLAKKREQLFEKWRQTLFVGNTEEGTKLHNEMEAIADEVETMIGRHPTGIEYSDWATMQPGGYFSRLFQLEVDKHKNR